MSRLGRSCFSLLVVAGFVLLCLWAVSIYQKGYGPQFGWDARLLDDQVVTYVDPSSPAARAGLKSGDKLVAFDDLVELSRPDQLDQVARRYRRTAVGAEYRLSVLRDSIRLDFQLSSSYSRTGLAQTKLIEYHAIALVYLVFGLILLLLKPYNREAMIFSAFMAGQAACYVPVLSTRFPGFVGTPLDIFQYLWIFATPYLFIQFCLTFPKPIVSNNQRKVIVLFLYGVFVIQASTYLIPKLIDLHRPLVYARSHLLQNMAITSFNAFYIVFITGCLIGVAANVADLRRGSNAQHRRKARLILIGMAVGLPPILVLNGAAHFLGFALQPIGAAIAGVLSLAFPAAFGYAIVKHRVMDVRLILRRSVKHLLISRLMLAVEAVVVILVLYHLVSPFVDRLAGKATGGTLVALAVISYSLISLAIGFVNRKLSRILDRLFFRDVHGAEQLLAELAQGIRSINDQKGLLKEVSTELMRALHIERVCFLLIEKAQLVDRPGNGNGNGKHAAAMPALVRWMVVLRDGEIDLAFEPWKVPTSKAGFLRSLFSIDSATEMDAEDERSFVHRLPAEVRNFIEEMGTNLLLPLREGNATIGFISLSRKLSDLPYTREDIRLLDSVAAQVTTAIERVWLLKEVAKQERLRQEMEIATMVQNKLFPPPLSGVSSLEVVGTCYPARSVGGDYYDFIRPCPGKLGIAIGDVSGKGISAALIMSSLQASVRSTASGDQEGVAGVVSIVNRLLCKSTDSDRFATFFYGLLDESAATLTYVNAGHDPPLVLRYGLPDTDDGSDAGLKVEIVRPTKGGIVLGVMDEFPYEQETIELQHGDIFIGFTDGVTEAVSPLEEFYGEERLLALVQQNLHLGTSALHSLILDDLRQFMGDMDQRDDITVIAIKFI